MTRRFETAIQGLASVREALFQAILPHCPPPRGKPPAGGGGTAAKPGAGGRLAPGQWKAIGRDVMKLHQGYTAGGEAFQHDANPIHGALAAYQMYFLPRNLVRVAAVLDALPWEAGAGKPPLPASWLEREHGERLLRILDLGCGSGAFTLGWLVWLGTRFPRGRGAPLIHVTLVDQGRRLLSLAEENLTAFVREALPELKLRITTHADGVEGFLSGPAGQLHGVVGGAMMLGELNPLGPRRGGGRARQLADALVRLVRKDGCIMLVEPGTRKGYMNLMGVRDRLAGLPILYPCPHARPCPFWHGRVSNWCHATLALPDPFFFDQELRRFGGLRFDMHLVNYSALVLQATGRKADAGAVERDEAPPARRAGRRGRAGHPRSGMKPKREQPPPRPPFGKTHGGRVVSAPLPARQASARARPGGTESPRQPRGKRHGGQDGAGITPSGESAGKVVLVCGEAGVLEERPARGLGRFSRGSWLPAAHRK